MWYTYSGYKKGAVVLALQVKNSRYDQQKWKTYLQQGKNSNHECIGPLMFIIFLVIIIPQRSEAECSNFKQGEKSEEFRAHSKHCYWVPTKVTPRNSSGQISSLLRWHQLLLYLSRIKTHNGGMSIYATGRPDGCKATKKTNIAKRPGNKFGVPYRMREQPYYG